MCWASTLWISSLWLATSLTMDPLFGLVRLPTSFTMDPLFNLVRLPTSFMDILSENALLLVYGLLSLYIVRKVQLYARLRHISGPFWAGFSDWPHRKAMLQSDCEAWYAGISEEHGARQLHGPLVTARQLILRRADGEGCAQRGHDNFSRRLGSCHQQARLQTLRLVLQGHAERASPGQRLHTDRQRETRWQEKAVGARGIVTLPSTERAS